MKNLNEKCAVFGIYNSSDAARKAYFGLFALQHRGQEQTGIVSSDGTQLYIHKGTGLVSQVYTEKDIEALLGHIAIGHNRYATTGEGSVRNIQPLFYSFLRRLCLLHIYKQYLMTPNRYLPQKQG